MKYEGERTTCKIHLAEKLTFFLNFLPIPAKTGTFVVCFLLFLADIGLEFYGDEYLTQHSFFSQNSFYFEL